MLVWAPAALGPRGTALWLPAGAGPSCAGRVPPFPPPAAPFGRGNGPPPGSAGPPGSVPAAGPA
eukprot:5882788-Alexandrium_andersonii.AAC.1